MIMTQACVIRRAKVDDIDALVRLLSVLFAIETDFIIDSQKQRTGLLLMLAETEQCCILVAEYKKEVVGMCTGQRLISSAEGGLKVILEDLIVDKKQRGMGIGSALLAVMESWAASCGAKRLDLLADQRNQPALDFYCQRQWENTKLTALQKRL